jgi:hypothetical protein
MPEQQERVPVPQSPTSRPSSKSNSKKLYQYAKPPLTNAAGALVFAPGGSHISIIGAVEIFNFESLCQLKQPTKKVGPV